MAAETLIMQDWERAGHQALGAPGHVRDVCGYVGRARRLVSDAHRILWRIRVKPPPMRSRVRRVPEESAHTGDAHRSARV